MNDDLWHAACGVRMFLQGLTVNRGLSFSWSCTHSESGKVPPIADLAERFENQWTKTLTAREKTTLFIHSWVFLGLAPSLWTLLVMLLSGQGWKRWVTAPRTPIWFGTWQTTLRIVFGKTHRIGIWCHVFFADTSIGQYLWAVQSSILWESLVLLHDAAFISLPNCVTEGVCLVKNFYFLVMVSLICRRKERIPEAPLRSFQSLTSIERYTVYVYGTVIYYT